MPHPSNNMRILLIASFTGCFAVNATDQIFLQQGVDIQQSGNTRVAEQKCAFCWCRKKDSHTGALSYCSKLEELEKAPESCVCKSVWQRHSWDHKGYALNSQPGRNGVCISDNHFTDWCYVGRKEHDSSCPDAKEGHNGWWSEQACPGYQPLSAMCETDAWGGQLKFAAHNESDYYDRHARSCLAQLNLAGPNQRRRSSQLGKTCVDCWCHNNIPHLIHGPYWGDYTDCDWEKRDGHNGHSYDLFCRILETGELKFAAHNDSDYENRYGVGSCANGPSEGLDFSWMIPDNLRRKCKECVCHNNIPDSTGNAYWGDYTDCWETRKEDHDGLTYNVYCRGVDGGNPGLSGLKFVAHTRERFEDSIGAGTCQPPSTYDVEGGKYVQDKCKCRGAGEMGKCGKHGDWQREWCYIDRKEDCLDGHEHGNSHNWSELACHYERGDGCACQQGHSCANWGGWPQKWCHITHPSLCIGADESDPTAGSSPLVVLGDEGLDACPSGFEAIYSAASAGCPAGVAHCPESSGVDIGHTAPTDPASCWVFCYQCPNVPLLPVRQWLRDTWGENRSNLNPSSAESEDVCTARKKNYATWCGVESEECVMKFNPPSKKWASRLIDEPCPSHIRWSWHGNGCATWRQTPHPPTWPPSSCWTLSDRCPGAPHHPTRTWLRDTWGESNLQMSKEVCLATRKEGYANWCQVDEEEIVMFWNPPLEAVRGLCKFTGGAHGAFAWSETPCKPPDVDMPAEMNFCATDGVDCTIVGTKIVRYCGAEGSRRRRFCAGFRDESKTTLVNCNKNEFGAQVLRGRGNCYILNYETLNQCEQCVCEYDASAEKICVSAVTAREQQEAKRSCKCLGLPDPVHDQHGQVIPFGDRFLGWECTLDNLKGGTWRTEWCYAHEEGCDDAVPAVAGVGGGTWKVWSEQACVPLPDLKVVLCQRTRKDSCKCSTYNTGYATKLHGRDGCTTSDNKGSSWAPGGVITQWCYIDDMDHCTDAKPGYRIKARMRYDGSWDRGHPGFWSEKACEGKTSLRYVAEDSQGYEDIHGGYSCTGVDFDLTPEVAQTRMQKNFKGGTGMSYSCIRFPFGPWAWTISAWQFVGEFQFCNRPATTDGHSFLMITTNSDTCGFSALGRIDWPCQFGIFQCMPSGGVIAITRDLLAMLSTACLKQKFYAMAKMKKYKSDLKGKGIFFKSSKGDVATASPVIQGTITLAFYIGMRSGKKSHANGGEVHHDVSSREGVDVVVALVGGVSVEVRGLIGATFAIKGQLTFTKFPNEPIYVTFTIRVQLEVRILMMIFKITVKVNWNVHDGCFWEFYWPKGVIWEWGPDPDVRQSALDKAKQQREADPTVQDDIEQASLFNGLARR